MWPPGEEDKPMWTGGDERVCFETRRHGVVLLRAFVRSFALLGAGVALLALGWPLSVAGAALTVVAALLALLAVWRWQRTLVVVTTEKLFVVHGIVRRRAAAVRLSRVGAIEVEQTLLGRLLGYGTLCAGELEIDYVPAPRHVYGLVSQLSA
jgi:uncharacterized membrane protein YdbT with pleckstrin-like domain